MFEIDVLGSKYRVLLRKSKDDKSLEAGADGYFDKSVRKIVIERGENDDKKGKDIPTGRLEDILEFRKAVLRHEIVHAFLYESGLTKSSTDWSENEQVVEWIALQIRKMAKCMADAERKLDDEYRGRRTEGDKNRHPD